MVDIVDDAAGDDNNYEEMHDDNSVDAIHEPDMNTEIDGNMLANGGQIA